MAKNALRDIDRAIAAERARLVEEGEGQLLGSDLLDNLLAQKAALRANGRSRNSHRVLVRR